MRKAASNETTTTEAVPETPEAPEAVETVDAPEAVEAVDGKSLQFFVCSGNIDQNKKF